MRREATASRFHFARLTERTAAAGNMPPNRPHIKQGASIFTNRINNRPRKALP